MNKRKIILFIMLVFFVSSSIICLLPSVYAINYTVSDVEDDVLRDCPTGEETGNFHDEIDIIELEVTGQYINLTVAGSLANWNSSYFGGVLFSPRITTNAFNDRTWITPYYTVYWQNPIEVILERGYSLSGNNFVYEKWNGTGWEDYSTAIPFNILYEITNHSVVIHIPDGVEDIPNNMQVVGHTGIFFYGGCDYSDLTKIRSVPNGNIPGYNSLIFLSVMFGISLIIIKKYKR